MTKKIEIEVPDGKEAVITDNGVEFVDDSGKKTYYRVSHYGWIVSTFLYKHEYESDSIDFFNIFETKEQAEKAAGLMRRSNAIIRACLMVDPDFDADWMNEEQEKYFFAYDHLNEEWYYSQRDRLNSRPPACVSTEEKAQEVCKLLAEWGL